MTTRRTGTRKLGWCLDQLHSKCITVTISGQRCSCDCHDTPNPQPNPDELTPC